MSLVTDAQRAGESVGLKSDKIVINGGKPLRGRIEIRGAKNLATKAMVAALLADTPSVLKNVPDAKIGLVSGFGMITYDRGLASGAALLAGGDE